MPVASANRPWNLESFLDSLIVELDKARDTLALKAVTRPLSYSVQDVGLEVQVFPQYDGSEVRFVTAEPGQSGASGLKIQLGSITSRGIAETTSAPVTKDDISIESLEGVDPETKAELRKVGVKSVRDIERMEERNVDLDKATDSKLDYGALAGVINKARRRKVAPTVTKVAMSTAQGEPVLSIEGRYLDIARSLPQYPVARIDGERVDVVRSSPTMVALRVDPERLGSGERRLELALDPFAVVSMNLEVQR
jgi:hypothetical protein